MQIWGSPRRGERPVIKQECVIPSRARFDAEAEPACVFVRPPREVEDVVDCVQVVVEAGWHNFTARQRVPTPQQQLRLLESRTVHRSRRDFIVCREIPRALPYQAGVRQTSAGFSHGTAAQLTVLCPGETSAAS